MVVDGLGIDERWARGQGGVVTRRVLLAWGNSDADIRRALRTGNLTRLRPGWFALPGSDGAVTAAVRAGGSLACTSALAWHAAWVLRAGRHLRVGKHGRLGPGEHACRCPGLTDAPRRAVDPVPVALASASRCCSEEEFLVVLESVVNLRLMSRSEVELLFAGAPRRTRRVVGRMQCSESGIETLVRNRLQNRHVQVRSQVVVPGVGRVDLLVGNCLVIEVDGYEHHGSRESYEADRARDRRLRALGFQVVRVSYRQVMYDWPCVEADILAMVRRGDHRRKPRVSC